MNEEPAQDKESDNLTGDALTIAFLKANLEELRTGGIITVAMTNPNVMSYMEHWEGRAEKAEAEVKVLSGALAGMLDIWSGYPTPECDAAISAMQYIGVDRWSARAALEITSDDLIEAAGLSK